MGSALSTKSLRGRRKRALEGEPCVEVRWTRGSRQKNCGGRPPSSSAPASSQSPHGRKWRRGLHFALWSLGKACRICKNTGPRIPLPQANCPTMSPQPKGSDPVAVVSLPSVPDDVLARTSQLLSCTSGTPKHIPKPCRQAWCDAYAVVLQKLHERLDQQENCSVALRFQQSGLDEANIGEAVRERR